MPRPEHPRPDFRREPWINLNGRWRFTFDPENAGEQLRWHRLAQPDLQVVGSTDGTTGTVLTEDPFGAEIVVPFPWESRLSDVGDPKYKGAAWYQRVLTVPAEWAGLGPRVESAGGDAAGLPSVEDTATSEAAAGSGVAWRWHPHLCFGAVDWHARVWIDGRFATEHAGGYTPFSVDLSQYVRPGRPATLTVRVWDVSDADTPTGKQTPRWYTPSSGIWQTVWLEGRPDAYLAQVHITPHADLGGATFEVDLAAPAELAGQERRITITSPDEAFPAVGETATLTAGTTAVRLEVRVPGARVWSPEDPHLYACRVALAPPEGAPAGPLGPPGPAQTPDAVATYFGLRSVSRGRWGGKPYEYVLLNGAPVYLRGALDQAFHPDALHAYPTDAALRADVQAAKALGLNCLRCHIKANDPRYYYWCDRLGLLVLYDLPAASIYTPKARANWERTFREAVGRDYSHPCVVAWILFNETWGLEEHQRPEGWSWVKEMYYLAKSLDPTRLVEDNSPYLYDHVTTDINTWHFYIGDYDRARRHVQNVVEQSFEGSPYHYVGGVYADVAGSDAYRQGTQPLLNSEYAGMSAWGGDRDISYTFKFLTGELRRHDMVCGYVYTQLTDVEWEHNGLLNYDRSPKAFGYEHFVPGMTVADLTGPDFVGLDCPPCQTLRPGALFRATPFFSHWSHAPLAGARLCWRVTAVDRFGVSGVAGEGERPVAPRRYSVTVAEPIEVQLPEELSLVTIAFWIEDGAGQVRARNYVNVDVYASRLDVLGEPLPGGQGYALRFVPGDFIGSSWLDARIGPRGSKFGAPGSGWVDYAVALPDDLDLQAVKGLRLRFEAGARTAHNRLDWRDPRHMQLGDYPQTEARQYPSQIAVWVNGVRIGGALLPDDPADSRGVLSLHNSDYWEAGSYGFLVNLAADEALTRRIVENAQGGRLIVRFEVPAGGVAGGLNLYGVRMGAYPLAPTVFLEL